MGQAVALTIGLLIGLERGWHERKFPERGASPAWLSMARYVAMRLTESRQGTLLAGLPGGIAS